MVSSACKYSDSHLVWFSAYIVCRQVGVSLMYYAITVTFNNHKGTQDPGQRLSTPVQFFKLWSHWSKNDGSNLGSHWWKYCLRICAKPNIWNNNNVRNWTFIVLQGVIRAVDQGKGSHQQAQPLPEVRVFYLAYLQKHLFALWMGSGEAQIWRWSEWDLGTWGLGSHESGEDEA